VPAMNNPAREAHDWSDIRMILTAAGEQGTPIDWELVADYLEIFKWEVRMPELKKFYGTTDPS
jgi:hypothetical protein